MAGPGQGLQQLFTQALGQMAPSAGAFNPMGVLQSAEQANQRDQTLALQSDKFAWDKGQDIIGNQQNAEKMALEREKEARAKLLYELKVNEDKRKKDEHKIKIEAREELDSIKDSHDGVVPDNPRTRQLYSDAGLDPREALSPTAKQAQADKLALVNARVAGEEAGDTRKRAAQKKDIKKDLLNQGLPEAEAERYANGIVNGTISAEPSDDGVLINFIDLTKIVAETKGKETEDKGGSFRVQQDAPPPREIEPVDESVSIFGSVSTGSGITAAVRRGVAKIPGKDVTPEQAEAIAAGHRLEAMKEPFIEMFAKSGSKIPVSEQNRLIKLFSVDPSIWNTEALSAKLGEIDRSARGFLSDYLENSQDPRIDAKTRQEYSAIALKLHQSIEKIGYPREYVDAVIEDPAEIENMSKEYFGQVWLANKHDKAWLAKQSPEVLTAIVAKLKQE